MSSSPRWKGKDPSGDIPVRACGAEIAEVRTSRSHTTGTGHRWARWSRRRGRLAEVGDAGTDLLDDASTFVTSHDREAARRTRTADARRTGTGPRSRSAPALRRPAAGRPRARPRSQSADSANSAAAVVVLIRLVPSARVRRATGLVLREELGVGLSLDVWVLGQFALVDVHAEAWPRRRGQRSVADVGRARAPGSSPMSVIIG